MKPVAISLNWTRWNHHIMNPLHTHVYMHMHTHTHTHIHHPAVFKVTTSGRRRTWAGRLYAHHSQGECLMGNKLETACSCKSCLYLHYFNIWAILPLCNILTTSQYCTGTWQLVFLNRLQCKHLWSFVGPWFYHAIGILTMEVFHPRHILILRVII